MAEPHHNQPAKVSLERLIHLKRSEKPPAAFWEDFDRELHRRQLAALVSLEPWHLRAVRVLASTARRFAPASAGVAALALAVFALVRVDPTGDTAAESTAALAMADTDNKVVILPEEAISVSTHPTPGVRTTVEEFRGNVRSAPQELAAGLASARRFVAVSAPVTFSSDSDASAIYSARALTAGAVLRSLTATAPESL